MAPARRLPRPPRRGACSISRNARTALVVYSSARHRNRFSPGTQALTARPRRCSEPPAFWCGNGRAAFTTRYGPRVPHARGNGDVPRAPTALARFSASNGSNKHNRTSLGSSVQESGIEVAPARLRVPKPQALSATPKRTAPATFGRPGLMSLRSGSMPLAPDRDRCRVVARFPYPQGIRPINADPLDSFEWTEASTSRPRYAASRFCFCSGQCRTRGSRA